MASTSCICCPDCGQKFGHVPYSSEYTNFTPFSPSGSICYHQRPFNCECSECRNRNQRSLTTTVDRSHYSKNYSSNNTKVQVSEEKEDGSTSLFKKPALLSSLFGSIWNPFSRSGSTITKASDKYEEDVEEVNHRTWSRMSSVVRPTPPPPSQTKGHHSNTMSMSLSSLSDSGSQISWFSGLLNWSNQTLWGEHTRLSNWRKRRSQEEEDLEYDEDDNETPPKSKLRRSSLGEREINKYEQILTRTRDRQKQYQSSYYSSGVDSDRLNLSSRVLPPLSRNARVQSWLDKLVVNTEMTTVRNSTSRGQDSPAASPKCHCKSGELEKRQELIMSYMVSSGEEMKKLQKILQDQADKREKEVMLLNSLSKTNETLKSEIAECASTQRNIIDKFILESSILDIEFDVEERMNAAAGEETLQECQDKLFKDILKRESNSMIRLFST